MPTRMRRRSFRFRVAMNFAGFGALVSLLLCVGVYIYAHDMGQRLMDETLQAELQDYLARMHGNPKAMLPATLTLSAYVLDGGTNDALVPPALKTLATGTYEIVLDGVSNRVLVSESAGKRYLFLFNETLQYQREQEFIVFLGVGALTMTLLSSLGGFWLARRVVAPVTGLAARVAAAGPAGEPPALATVRNGDEVEELARVFDRYLARIQSCMERERDFTANVSHELRTPLAIIRGAVEVLEDDLALNPEQRERLARIGRASHDMTHLTSALLHLAREESALPRENCNMARVVRESVEKYSSLDQDRLLDVDLEIQGDVELPVARILAIVVVDNLIGNAFQHSASTRIEVRLTRESLVIRDSGTGIAADELDQLFLRHQRGAQSTGAGIGLSLVKRICDLQGWETRIDSVAGQGTEVSLRFRSRAPSI